MSNAHPSTRLADRFTRAAVGVLLVGGVLTGCSSGGDEAAPEPSPSATATPTPTPAVAPPAPKPGACTLLTYDEGLAPTVAASPVSCTESHTAETFKVGELDTVIDGHLVAVDSARVRDQVAQTCPQQLTSWVGGTAEQRRLSMIRAVWFTPTVKQSDAGHNWYRCDAVVLAGKETLLPLTSSIRGALDTSAGRDRYGMCSTGKPGTTAFNRVVCAASHTWRAIATIRVEANADGTWPGVKASRSAGESRCKSMARARAEDKLKFSWGYEWPTRAQWDAGTHYGTCWIPD